MGNKLSNPDDITSEDIAAYQSKNSKKEHVLRLWVDLFNVKEDDSEEAELQWYKITEDVVPASVTCVHEDPNTAYHIKAYNSQVEKICDIKIIQPGTKLKQPTECFIHLKDVVTEKHWGFNFTSADDAAKFRDTCLTLSVPSVPKSSSFGTLRLRGRKWKSGSTRDGGGPKRSETVDGLSSFSAGSHRPSYGRDMSGIITAPRFRQQPTRVDSRSLFAKELSLQSANKQAESQPVPPTLPLIFENAQAGESSLISNGANFSDAQAPQLTDAASAGSSRLVDTLDLAASPALLDASPGQLSSEQSSSCDDSDSDSEYDKPATLSAAHLNAILFSCENIATSTDKEASSRAEPRHGVISEEDEDADETLQEEDSDELTSNIDLTVLAEPFTSSTKEPVDELLPAVPQELANDLSSNRDLIMERDPSQGPPTSGTKSNNDSTLHKMLQSLPAGSESNASFGIEAEPGDPSITAPLQNVAPSSDLLRRPSNRSQSSTSRFGGSSRSKKSDDTHSLISSNGFNNKLLIEYEQHLRHQDAEGEDDPSASLYQDSGFGGTVSTNKSASIKSSKSKMSRQSSRISEKSNSSIVTGSESVYSSSSSSQLTKSSDLTQVKPFTLLSDHSEPEDDENDNSSTHSFTTQPAVIKSYTSLARQSGTTRKTGWLEVKNWLMHSKKKLTLASKRHWKRYWVTLRGTTLMFYSCDDQSSLTDEAMPRHIIYIDGSIAQSVPEHPKRDNIFSVSSAYGDAYLFQAQTQIEHDNWITSIHSACAAQNARQNGKTNPLKVLQAEIEKLQEHIDSDSKMKKMAELQLTVVKELKSRSAITKQIHTWEENLECLFMDQYRFKCYLSSLQDNELPNPKYILSSMSRRTKQKLGKLGILNATSFHSLICIRTPNAYHTYIDQHQRKGLLSTLRQNSTQSSRLRVTAETFVPPQTGSDDGEEYSGNYDDSEGSGVSPEPSTKDDVNSCLGTKFGDNLTRILIPNNQSIVVATDDDMSVQQVLEIVCSKRQLVFNECFLRIRTKYSTDYLIPKLDELFEQLDYDRVEVCPKTIFQVEIVRLAEEMFGVEVEAELADDAETEDELKVFIEQVDEGSPAHKAGIIVGDELLTLNDKVVAELDIEHIDSVLANDTRVCVTVRSCRLKKPDNTIASVLTNHADTYIDNMMCPPPPSQARISERVIDDLIVPAPTWVHNTPEEGGAEDLSLTPRTENEKSVTNIKDLLHSAEQVTHFCRMAHERLETDEPHPIIMPSVQPLSEAQKLRKIILELINTERSYVRDLSMLMERYLEPLKEETFLSSEEVVRLVGNIQEIVHFQKEFLKNLEESIDDESFMLYTVSYEFKKVLFSIAGSFIYYANHFKLYSSFCASHSRAQKVLSPGDNSELYEFLHARNPKQQHSATLESYLIKPIQRILKYPLLLQQLRSLTDPESNEYTHLNDALKAMESVAEHINEMQKIYEEFGSVFDDLTRTYTNKPTNHGGDKNKHTNHSSDVNKQTNHIHDKKKLELNVGDLQYYGEADWLNAYDDISKPRKGLEHTTTIFVFKHGIVLLCQEKIKGKLSKYKNGKGNTLDCGPETTYYKFLPVTEIQVRTLPTTHAGGPVALWELLHLKSATESRPEKIYHMACSAVDKRSEFLKYMRLIIRESVKRMTVPKSRQPLEAEVRLRHSTVDQTRYSFIDPTPLRHSVTVDPRDRSSKSGSGHYKTHAHNSDNRFSMNLDSDRLTIPELDLLGGRSRTYGDLVDFDDGGVLNIRNTSINSVNSDTSQGSAAVLVYSSQDPIAYSSKGSLTYSDPTSPIWEKRSNGNETESSHLSTNVTLEPRSLKIHELYLNTATEC